MTAGTQYPNIIYILGDDHRQDFTSLEGHDVVQTPNLAALCQEGYYFKNSFCTSPVCTPSRACHYSGLWERAHGINFNSKSSMSLEAWANTFPMILKQHGYQTAWVGKNHVPVGEKAYQGDAMEQTFDYWYGNHNHSFFYPKENPGHGEIYKNAALDTQVEVFEEGAMNFLDPQKEFIESCSRPLIYRDTTKPFCMCLTFNLPHDCSTDTMELRESDDEMYKSLYRDQLDALRIPETYIAKEDITTPRLPAWLYSGEYIPSYNYVKTIPALKERMVRICQTVTGVDRAVGHLRAKLDELGIADNTIIVFSTDHGIHHGEHGLGGKCFLYEQDLRIPLMIYDPRNKPQNGGKVIEEMVAVPDFAPTILALAGVEIPSNMQGTSMLPLLGQTTQPATPWREELFVEQLMDTQNYAKSEAIRTKDWKYIRYFARTEDPAYEGYRIRNTADDYYAFLTESTQMPIAYEELYHIAQDANEVHNLVDDADSQAQLAYFRGRIGAMVQARVQENIDARVCYNSRQLFVMKNE